MPHTNGQGLYTETCLLDFSGAAIAPFQQKGLDVYIHGKKHIRFVFFVILVVLLSYFTTFSYLNLIQSGIHHEYHISTKNARSTEIPIKTIADRQKYLKPVLKGGVKKAHLIAKVIRWEYMKGRNVLVWGFNGQTPGLEIRVKGNDKVHLMVTKKLPKAITIHWHSVDVLFEQDGVHETNQKAIQPGEVYIYEFVTKPAGTRLYHAHGSNMMDQEEQLDMGLSGAFIIEPRNHKRADREYVTILDDWQTMSEGNVNGHSGNYDFFTISGFAFPSTDPIKVRKDERFRLGIINASVSTIHPSEAYDIEFIANNPGTWLFHCHELHCADARMIRLVVYNY